jgi:hypothetical protein
VRNPIVDFDGRAAGGFSGASAPTAQGTDRDLDFYKTLGAALQVEVNRLNVKQALAVEVLRTLTQRYSEIIAECDAGRMLEQDAIRRLDNLANTAFHSITKMFR